MRVRLTAIDNDERAAMPSGSTMSRYEEGRVTEAERNRGTREAPRPCNRPCLFCTREPYGAWFLWKVTMHHQTQCVFASQILPPFGVVILLIQGDARILLQFH